MQDSRPRLVDLDEVVSAAQALEPLPRTLSLLLAAASSTEPDFETICDVVAMDPALTGKVLRVANSAAGAGRQVVRVREAVVLLGAASVVTMALGERVKRDLSASVPAYGLDAGVLWEHSVRASLAAEGIRAMAGAPIPVAAVSAGLLHDVGKLVMAQFLTHEVLDLINEAIASGSNRLDAERELLEVDHGELGALVAQSWELPSELVVGIAHHHHPEMVEDACAYTTFLADNIADRSMGRTGDAPATEETFAKACQWLSLSERSIERIMGRVSGEVSAIMAT